MHVSKSLPVPHYTDIVKKLVFNFYVDDSIVKILFVDYSSNIFDTIETAI